MVKQEKAEVLLDIDGVLGDCVRSCQELFGKKFDWANGSSMAKQLGYSEEEFKDNLNQTWLWRDMHLTKEAPRLIELLKSYGLYDRAIIVSSTFLRPHILEGRMYWLQKHFPDFVNQDRVIFIKDKWRLASKTQILIDDYSKNVYNFRRAGGWAITFPRPWNMANKIIDPVAFTEIMLEVLLIKGESENDL